MEIELIAVKMPTDLKRALEDYAKSQDLSLSQVCRRALREFLERLPK